MKRFNKLFAKKDKPEEHTGPDPPDLSTLSPAEVSALVIKYDEEVKRLLLSTQTLTEEKDKAVYEAVKRSEESKLYKEVTEV